MNPLSPYLFWIKLSAVAGIAVTLFVGGCQHGKKTQFAKDEAQIKQLDSWLNAVREQVAICASTLKGIDSETAQREAAALAQAAEAKDAAEAAKRGESAAKKRAADFEAALAKAKKKPACKALLETDLEATCALSLH